ncbi:antibiotic biosynthesis monooxygenase [Pseudomonas hamedanensis]|uniref:Antibiotic biosynthesis monooxygenase n=1 Tax=Pseudomonas hamedanensis TaxID=2745504 RepID=A0A9E6P4R2_9PSED|nr:antibiotic biosynthesis monooxygenase [Pseudomonas hamedanensis]QXI19905.1 antibiotic biosynthesis monooxygenase [Pseudomonas hamedanensis]
MGAFMKNHSFTQLIEFEIEPRQQPALVSALATQTEHLAQRYAGFLSASVQASDDGRRVLSLLQWQTREAGEAAFRSFESGEENFWQLIRSHRAKTVTFNSFQVLSSIARSHDDALHCNLVG